MSEPAGRSDATVPPPAFLQLHRALADLAMASGQRAPLAHHTVGRHLAFLPPEALELDLSDAAQRDFGDYELLEKLGQGGMGVVYRARQKSLDREVAVKLLAAGPWASRDFIERFRREAQSAARMQHPGIVPIFEVGAHDELNYFSMQLVRGESLAGLLAREGNLAPRRAAALLRTVAEAVDYAHRLGVLHLDLKPGNVLIDERGEPLVADFGLARRLDETLAADSDEISGTPSYMAPEQALVKSHKLSPATDVYGLGAILYEFLTGRPPFLGHNPQETLKRVVDGEVERPRSLRPGVPADLEAICLKCLAKTPTQRYGSTRELADDLARFLDGRAVLVRPLNAGQRIVRWARREPRLAFAVVVAASALLLGAGVATQQWLRAESGAALARASLWQYRMDTSWRVLSEQGALAILPAMVANLSEQEATGATRDAALSRVRLGALDAVSPQLIDLIESGGNIGAVALAPDGSWVASLRSNELTIHDVATGLERCRARISASIGMQWGGAFEADLRPVGNGARILVAPFVTNVTPEPPWEGTLVETRDCSLRLPPAERFGPNPVATWSPDGEYAIVRRDVESTGELLRASDWTTIAPVATTQMRGNLWLLAPTLAHVVVAAEEWRRLEFLDPASLALRHQYVHGDRETLRAVAWTRQGTRLATAFERGDIVLFDPATGAGQALAPRSDGEPFALAFDDSDAWLAATSYDGSVRVWDVATGQLATGPIRNPAGAAWAIPDSTGRAVFVRTRGEAQLWSALPETKPVLKWQLPEFSSHFRGVPAAWLGEEALLATGNDRGDLRIWRAPPPITMVPVQAPPLAMNEGDPSFDGRHVVGVDGAEVVVMDLDTGAAVGPPVIRSQAVAFALLATDPVRLVTSAGRDLQVHDPASGLPIHAAIMLENSPTLVALAPVTQALLVGFSARNGERNVVVLESYVLATGARTGRIELDGLHAIVGFSGDGQRVVTALAGTVRVLDAVTLAESWPAIQIGADALAQLREYYAAPGALGAAPDRLRGPYVFPGMDSASGTLWIYAARRDLIESGAASARHQLLAFDAVDGRQVSTLDLEGPIGTMRALARGRVAIVANVRGELSIVSRDGPRRSIPVAGLNPYAGTAVSVDGRRLAVALARGAVVFDIDSGQWLTPPLAGGLELGDAISGISLDATGSQVLLRTVGRHWVRHRLPVEDRTLADVQQSLRWTHEGVDGMGTSTSAAIDNEARARLRAADRGSRAATAPAIHVTAAAPVSREREPRFVDLAPACTTHASGQRSRFAFDLGRVLTPGRHRLLGTDFEVGCGVHASMSEVDPVSGQRYQLRTRKVPLALGHFESMDLLVTADTLYHDLADVAYAWIEIGYRDGSVARMPIIYRRQVWEHWQSTPHGGDARVAYFAMSSRDATGGSDVPTLFAVRMENPNPEREVDHLVLEAVDRPWSTPLLLAVTLNAAPVPGGNAP